MVGGIFALAFLAILAGVVILASLARSLLRLDGRPPSGPGPGPAEPSPVPDDRRPALSA